VDKFGYEEITMSTFETKWISVPSGSPAGQLLEVGPLGNNIIVGSKNVSALSEATDVARGLVELATTAETQAGTDTERAIVPASLHKKQWKTYLAQHFQLLGTETNVLSLVSLGSGVVLAGTSPTGSVFRLQEVTIAW